MHKTMRYSLLASAVLLLGVSSGAQAQQVPQAPNMSFFVTSAGPGKGGDLGGLAGADAHCQTLAVTAGAGVADVWLWAFEPCSARPPIIASTTNPAPKMSFVEKSVFIVCWLYSQRCQLDSAWTSAIQTGLNI